MFDPTARESYIAYSSQRYVWRTMLPSEHAATDSLWEDHGNLITSRFDGSLRVQFPTVARSEETRKNTEERKKNKEGRKTRSNSKLPGSIHAREKETQTRALPTPRLFANRYTSGHLPGPIFVVFPVDFHRWPEKSNGARQSSHGKERGLEGFRMGERATVFQSCAGKREIHTIYTCTRS